jgi:hypothetical protein
MAAGLGAGLPWAPGATAALLAGFAVVQAVALARGRNGAPCGCFGARGRLSPGSLGRTALLAAACAALPAPVVAISGITLENVADVARAGAASAAVIGDLFDHGEPRPRAEALAREFARGRAERGA